MAAVSRRQLAKYAVEEFLAGQKPATLAKRLAAMLLESDMASQVDLLISDIDQELEARGLLAQVVVTSANGLSAQLRAQLSKQVKAAAKVKEVSLNEQTDARVIGGVRVETALHSWDKTIAHSLSEIKGVI